MITAVVLIEADRDQYSKLGGVLADVQGVAEAYSVTGGWDFVALVRVPRHELLATVSRMWSAWPWVSRIASAWTSPASDAGAWVAGQEGVDQDGGSVVFRATAAWPRKRTLTALMRVLSPGSGSSSGSRRSSSPSSRPTATPISVPIASPRRPARRTPWRRSPGS